ncbi:MULTISPECIES: barstar family protein [unclassified Nocardia]|uniref:barstar family protein n=1 Tax=unclassified Nocardia TaxID=2637762 RepID=UPI001CE410F1|nr:MULTISPECIES: barstar family protein [unclassified Nocardia]
MTSAEAKPVLVIDGSAFDDFEGFAREFSKLLDDYVWRGNLDAFNDILRGGFGTPEDGFVLQWLHSERSREALGWAATIARLGQVATTCHPDNREHFAARIAAARRREGRTLFDEVVAIIRDHGPGGQQQADGVDLELR